MQSKKYRLLELTAILIAFVSICLFLIPAFVIRPFRYQSPRALSLAIAVKSIAPVLSLPLCVLLLALVAFLWKRSSWAGRTIATVALLLTVASAVMVRQNYFEWMFHPIAAAGFVHSGD